MHSTGSILASMWMSGGCWVLARPMQRCWSARNIFRPARMASGRSGSGAPSSPPPSPSQQQQWVADSPCPFYSPPLQHHPWHSSKHSHTFLFSQQRRPLVRLRIPTRSSDLIILGHSGIAFELPLAVVVARARQPWMWVQGRVVGRLSS